MRPQECGGELEERFQEEWTRARESPGPGEREGQSDATAQDGGWVALRVEAAFAGVGVGRTHGSAAGGDCEGCGRTLAFVRLMFSWDGSDSGSITPRWDGMQGE